MLAFIIAVLMVFSSGDRKSVPGENIITVSGTGSVFAPPDVATISFTASARADSVPEAQETANTSAERALASLRGLGIEDADIRTTGYNVYPNYERISPPCTPSFCPPYQEAISGYTVSQTVSVKIRQVDTAGEVLAELGRAEVSNISGLSFEVDDEDALMREARKEAIEDARTKARALAKDLGVRLGKVVSFSEYGYPMGIMMRSASMEMGMGGDMAMPSVALPQGQNEIVSNVSVTYRIK